MRTIIAGNGIAQHMAPIAELPPRRSEKEDGPKARISREVRILVLDDDTAVGRLVQAALAGHGFLIDAVSQPAMMESQVQEHAYQLIILDYVLPGLDAATVMEWVHTHQPDASIIVVTAFPSIDSALHCLRSHIYDYIAKPFFKIEDLQKAVTRCLESRGLLRLSEEALRKHLGNAIRDRRKTLGLTLADMAKRSNVSLGYLSQIELGKNSASIETLYRIALGLRLRIADLFQSVQTTF